MDANGTPQEQDPSVLGSDEPEAPPEEQTVTAPIAEEATENDTPGSTDEPDVEAGAVAERSAEPSIDEPAPEPPAEQAEEQTPAAVAEGTDEQASEPDAETAEEPVAHADDELVDEQDAEPVADEQIVLEEPAAETEASPELVAAVEEVFVAEAGDGEEGETEPQEVLDWVPGDWYVVHTYAGYENKVKADLESRVASMNMEESIYEVVIPMEEVMEIKSGKKQMVPRKVFPGYLLVRMDLNDDSWYVVRNTPGVTGFVGSGNKPIPLSDKEVDKILRRKGEPEKPKTVAEWQVNDPVRVTTGPFANFQGSISEVDGERQKVKVLVNIFGRETPVELAFDQIAKV